MMNGLWEVDMMTVQSGLEGIVVAESDLSLVDGSQGYLVYRGCWAKELALHQTFEETVFLLWYGRLPTAGELKEFRSQLAKERRLPASVVEIISRIPQQTDMMSVLRTAISSLELKGASWPPTVNQGISILAKIPMIIAYRHHLLKGTPVPEYRFDLSHGENYLYMLSGKVPVAAHTRSLDSYLILTAEHGMNASTFAARVVTSTQSDLLSALTAAIGALKGPLHGGAPAEVENMLESIGTSDQAESWLRERLDQGEKLMGFGHRIYKTRDPRAEALQIVARNLAPEEPWFQLAVEVEQTALRLLHQRKPNKSLHTNVEFYAAAVLRAVGLPKELYTPTFALSRTAGWCAHILEQAAANRIIRPQSRYTGSIPEF